MRNVNPVMSPEEYQDKAAAMGIPRGALASGFDEGETVVLRRMQEFEAAYVRWKKREFENEPAPQDYGLSWVVGEAIARIVHRRFEEEVRQRLKAMKPLGA